MKKVWARLCCLRPYPRTVHLLLVKFLKYNVFSVEYYFSLPDLSRVSGRVTYRWTFCLCSTKTEHRIPQKLGWSNGDGRNVLRVCVYMITTPDDVIVIIVKLLDWLDYPNSLLSNFYFIPITLCKTSTKTWRHNWNSLFKLWFTVCFPEKRNIVWGQLEKM